ncbi:uncharacterized protein LOC121424068 [Lytechinus variegatus]|uniref:uncharacterized protein LOC121424068 n=1 Tax=Lytechinus variegatus TaxID=7654 RepID=UPI001BB1F4DD|nr:uncharacterized protein LOC121424068 [Lytechinus variegatus]
MNISMAIFRVLGVTLMTILIVEGSTRVTRNGCSPCTTSPIFFSQNLNYCRACHTSPIRKKSSDAAIYSDSDLTDVRQLEPDAEFLTMMIESTNDLLVEVLRLLQFEKEQLERIGSKPDIMTDDELRKEESERQKLLILSNMLRQ